MLGSAQSVTIHRHGVMPALITPVIRIVYPVTMAMLPQVIIQDNARPAIPHPPGRFNIRSLLPIRVRTVYAQNATPLVIPVIHVIIATINRPPSKSMRMKASLISPTAAWNAIPMGGFTTDRFYL
jgi:hypothetical protein